MKIRLNSKMLKKSEIYLKFFVLWLFFVCAYATRQNSFKINTDLTASVIDGSSGGIGGVGSNTGVGLIDEQSGTKNLQNQINASKLQSSNVGALMGLNATTDTHLCMREEIYVEEIQIPITQQVRVRSAEWCLEFPPRCSNYKTEMRQIMQTKNITETRTIRFCCDGYEASTILLNDTVCKPVCRGGCGRGHCETPDVCNCEAGYVGKHCTQRCDHAHWGPQCKNDCQCQNAAVCDNKSGLCHCVAGWIGTYCEQPCPPGTHGVMCRKACECASKHCHPQTGACEILPSNATHVIIATLNSTIANITTNLDRLAKNIDSITTPHTPAGIETVLLPEHLAPSAKSLPEVIVIKQEETPQTPKIIVHQQSSAAGILETIHNSAPKSPDVIHVITGGWPNITHDEKGLHLAGFGEKKEVEPNEHVEHDSGILSTLLIILLVILIAVVIGFLFVYRRYQNQKARVEAALNTRGGVGGGGIDSGIIGVMETGTMEENNAGSLGKSFLKPLPDLPAFTQMVRNKIEAHEYYDTPPSSNVSVQTPPYAYARKESLYSVVPPKSRRSSPDSHLYDEIRYTTEAANQHHHPHHAHQHHHHHHNQLQHQQHHRLQRHQLYHGQQNVPSHLHALAEEHATYNIPKPISHHVTQLIMPPQNSDFLQVPQQTTYHTTHRVAHI